MSRAASLGMYDFPWLQATTDALWADVRPALLAAGVAGVPDRLDRSRSLRAIWRDPTLLLAQTCGYPLLTELADAVQMVATPVYDFPGCDGVLHRSFVVVRADDPADSLEALRGRRCAINGRDSNTGMNLLRASVAPLAEGRPFFSGVVETGAHLDSLRAVREGRADLAAIDCVTYGLAARHQPALLQDTCILTETPATPCLPFVTSAATSAAEVAALRSALGAAVGRPTAAALGWAGMTILDLAAYAPVIALEREAEAAGYGLLA
jgi:ABC-type phosphate/phosphonate transport system substrate-binding protein